MSRKNLVSTGVLALMLGAAATAVYAQRGGGGGGGGFPGGPGGPGVVIIQGPQGDAPPPKAPPPSKPLAIRDIPARGGAKLTVTSPAFQEGKDIPGENTQYQFNLFPGLSWTPGPAGTKSYVLILQDQETAMADGSPNLHFSLYNLSVNTNSLKQNMDPRRTPPGASYGPNYYGRSQSYLGPRVQPGPKHHFHFEVFALDTALNNEDIADYNDLMDAIRGHVVASGELVGSSSADLDAGTNPNGGRGGPGGGGGGGGGRGG